MKRQTKPVRHTKTPTCIADDPDFCRVFDGSGYVDVSAYSTNSPSAPVTVTGAARMESPAERIARLEVTVKTLQAEIKKMKAKRRKA